MNPRRSATVTAVLCEMGGVAWFAGFGSAGIENTAAPTLDRLAPFHTADFEHTDAPQPAAMGNAGVAREARLEAGIDRITEDHTLYASHTIWESRAAFEAWTR